MTELKAELAHLQGRDAAIMRSVLAEVAAGIRSAPEGDLRDVIVNYGLPRPMYNPRLYLHGTFLASPDAWWRELGVAAEVDSKAWHFSPDSWNKTLARHARMTAQGILVLHFPPGKVSAEPRLVASEIRSALASSRGPLAHIRTVPASNR